MEGAVSSEWRVARVDLPRVGPATIHYAGAMLIAHSPLATPHSLPTIASEP